MFVKPAEGRLVRDPLTREILPPEGRLVSDTSFWRRRLLKGDVVQVVAAAKPGPTASAEESAPKHKK